MLFGLDLLERMVCPKPKVCLSRECLRIVAVGHARSDTVYKEQFLKLRLPGELYFAIVRSDERLWHHFRTRIDPPSTSSSAQYGAQCHRELSPSEPFAIRHMPYAPVIVNFSAIDRIIISTLLRANCIVIFIALLGIRSFMIISDPEILVSYVYLNILFFIFMRPYLYQSAWLVFNDCTFFVQLKFIVCVLEVNLSKNCLVCKTKIRKLIGQLTRFRVKWLVLIFG